MTSLVLRKQEIRSIVLVGFADAIREAEEMYARCVLGSMEQIRGIKDEAQKHLINSLVKYKKTYLSHDELEYVYQLFDELSANYDYFKLLKVKPSETNLLREARFSIEAEQKRGW